ncbi:MAG: hypothetical protein HY593_00875 [Candidatus Omnitrophica bacterium]|nr:hypothetical protein [Candidatus Omnitrophota bacterium]
MENGEKDFVRKKPLYEEAVRRHVCEHCVDFGADGVCHTKDPEGCGIFRFLPELVEIAHRIHNYQVEPYVEAVRLTLCVKCKNSGFSGDKCRLRENVDCGLNRYLPLVLEAIEEVDAACPS